MNGHLLLVQLPYGFDWGMIAPAAAGLKAYLNSKNITTEFLDLNGRWNECSSALQTMDLNATWQNTDKNKQELVENMCSNRYERFVRRIDPSFLAFLDRCALQIVQSRPKLIALSAYFRTAWLPALYLAVKIKELSSVPIVLGGAAFDLSVTQYVGAETPSKSVDFYLIGEGEIALERFWHLVGERRCDLAFSSQEKEEFIRDIPGLGFPLEGVGLRMGEKPSLYVEDLDTLPFGDYDDYRFDEQTTFPITIARSCNARCSFCSSRKTQDSFRMYSGERAASEILYMYERYGAKKFYFTAPLINGHPKNLSDMCRRLIDAGVDLDLSGLLRIKHSLHVEDLEQMVKAGFKWLKFGLESGSPKVRESMGKLADQEHSYRLMKAAGELGAVSATNIMHSYPTEDEAAFQETIDFLSRFRPDELDWNGWSFSLGFVGNGALDQWFIDRHRINVIKNHGMTPGIPTFALSVEWENDLITEKIRHRRQKDLQEFRTSWLQSGTTSLSRIIEVSPGE